MLYCCILNDQAETIKFIDTIRNSIENYLFIFHLLKT